MKLTPTQDRIIWGVAILSVLFLLALLVLPAYLFPQVELDEFGCVVDESPPRHTIFLVDRTDNLTPAQNEELQDIIREVSLDQSRLVDLPRYGLLSLYSFETIGNDGMQLDLIFEYCKPPSFDDANEITETPSYYQRQYEETFGAALLEQTEILTVPNESQRSFLLESIAFALASADYNGETPPRDLIIFSDMMQHSSLFTQYNPNPSAWLSAEEVLESDIADLSNLDLTGISVNIIYLPRANAVQTQGPRHRSYWETLLSDLGAESVRIRTTRQ